MSTARRLIPILKTTRSKCVLIMLISRPWKRSTTLKHHSFFLHLWFDSTGRLIHSFFLGLVLFHISNGFFYCPTLKWVPHWDPAFRCWVELRLILFVWSIPHKVIRVNSYLTLSSSMQPLSYRRAVAPLLFSVATTFCSSELASPVPISLTFIRPFTCQISNPSYQVSMQTCCPTPFQFSSIPGLPRCGMPSPTYL